MFRARVFIPSGVLINVVEFTDVSSNDTEVVFNNTRTKTITSFVLRNILFYEISEQEETK